MRINKRFEEMASFSKFCSEYNVDGRDGAKLLQLLQDRSNLSVATTDPKRMKDKPHKLTAAEERACRDLEQQAMACGFEVSFDSHIASLTRNGKRVDLPCSLS